MALTNVKGTQVLDGSIRRVDLNTATSGSAVITKIIGSNGLAISSSSGADSGTGDVTLAADLTFLDTKYASIIASRTQNYVLAGPSSGSGAAAFRALVAGDIPAIAISGVTALQTAIDGKWTIGGDALSGTGSLGSTTNQNIQLIRNSVVGLTLTADGITSVKKLAVGRSTGQGGVYWDTLAVFGGNITLGGRDSATQGSYDLNMVAHTTNDNANNSTRKARFKFGYFDAVNSVDKFKRTIEYWRSSDALVIGSHSTVIADTATTAPVEASSVYIGATGTVSIGVNATTYKFDVSGTGHFSGDVTFDANGILATAPTIGNHLTNKTYVDGKSWTISAVTGLQTALDAKLSGSGTSGYLTKYTGSLTQGNSGLFESGNNYGIGTTSPGYTIDSIRSGDSVIRLSTAATSNALSAIAFAYNTNASNNSIIGVVAGDARLRFAVAGNIPPTATFLNDYTRMVITNVGNIGFGTSFPGSNFELSQPTTGMGAVSNSAGGTTVTGSSTQFLNTFNVGDSITIGGQTVTISAIASNTSMTTSAITNANSGAAYTLVGGSRFVIRGNGYVGIGTNTPSYKLDVNGTGRFSGAVQFDAIPSTPIAATTANHLVNYATMQAYISGIKYDSVKVKTVALNNITLSGHQFIASYTTSGSDRVLVMGQSTASQNGVYISNSSTWTRDTNFDTEAEIKGFIHSVESGTYAGYKYINTNTGTITVGTTAITYVEFSSLVETDPIFTNSAAGGITSTHVTNWNDAYTNRISTKNTGDLTEGSNLYFTTARVLATALTGFSAGSNTAITASDTVLSAFQNVQGQLNSRVVIGGNTAGAAITIGTNDNFDFNLERNNAVQMAIKSGVIEANFDFDVKGKLKIAGSTGVDHQFVKYNGTSTVWATLDTGELSDKNNIVMLTTVSGERGFQMFADTSKTYAESFLYTNPDAGISLGLHGYALDASDAVKEFGLQLDTNGLLYHKKLDGTRSQIATIDMITGGGVAWNGGNVSNDINIDSNRYIYFDKTSETVYGGRIQGQNTSDGQRVFYMESPNIFTLRSKKYLCLESDKSPGAGFGDTSGVVIDGVLFDLQNAGLLSGGNAKFAITTLGGSGPAVYKATLVSA